MRAFTQTIVSPGHEISGVTAAVFIAGADLPGDDWAADDWAANGWLGAVGVLAITGADAIAAKLAMASTNRFMDDPVDDFQARLA